MYLDTFDVTRAHDWTFEKLDFREVSFEERFQFQLRSLAANTHNTVTSLFICVIIYLFIYVLYMLNVNTCRNVL